MLKIIEKHLPSGYSKRPISVKGIILHHISGINLDKNKKYDAEFVRQIFITYKVSAHFLINRDGSIWELVKPPLRCWHAGKSSFRGVSGLNSHTLGIEFVGSDQDEFEEEQYIAGAKLCAKLMADYNIPTKWITMHRIVSGSTVRTDAKQDPSFFWDWVHFSILLGDELRKT